MFTPSAALSLIPHSLCAQIPWRKREVKPTRGVNLKVGHTISIILGIAVLSGVCILTLSQAHPIFASERPFQEIKIEAKAAAITEADMEFIELERWNKATTLKYKNLTVQHPAKGVIHVKTTKMINGKPVKINIVEINQKANSKLNVKPQTASTTLNKKASIRSIASKENSIAAINGGYFKPQTGVPLGTLVIDKNVLTGPIYERVSIGINSDSTYSMDRAKLNIEMKNEKISVKIDNINQPRISNAYTLVYTPVWGEYAPPPPKGGLAVSIKNGFAIQSSTGPMAIPSNGYVVVGQAANVKELIKQGNLTLETKFPESFNNSEHIIGGGPYLVKNSELYIDVEAQKLSAITGKNPRTAIGYTANDELIIVTVDGREEASVGMTLGEIARLMKSLGCVNAMNLDGGGSSVMYVNGKIENRPAFKEGIPISNALVVNENTAVASN